MVKKKKLCPVTVLVDSQVNDRCPWATCFFFFFFFFFFCCCFFFGGGGLSSHTFYLSMLYFSLDMAYIDNNYVIAKADMSNEYECHEATYVGV